MKTIRILIDSREKEPLPFPANLPLYRPDGKKETVRILTSKSTMKTGDYRLETSPPTQDFPSCIIERKCGLREIQDCFMGRSRKRVCEASGQLDRLSTATPAPVLLLECSPLALLRQSAQNPDGPFLADRVLFECARHQIELHCLPVLNRTTRIQAGEWVARKLLAEEQRSK